MIYHCLILLIKADSTKATLQTCSGNRFVFVHQEGSTSHMLMQHTVHQGTQRQRHREGDPSSQRWGDGSRNRMLNKEKKEQPTVSSTDLKRKITLWEKDLRQIMKNMQIWGNKKERCRSENDKIEKAERKMQPQKDEFLDFALLTCSLSPVIPFCNFCSH